MIAAWVDVREAFLHLHRGDLDEARKLLEGATRGQRCLLLRAGRRLGLVRRARVAGLGGRPPGGGLCASGQRRRGQGDREPTGQSPPGPGSWRCAWMRCCGWAGSMRRPAAVSGFEAFDPGQDRFMAAALAAARFRLEPTLRGHRCRDGGCGGAVAVAARAGQLLARGVPPRRRRRRGRPQAVRGDRRPAGDAPGQAVLRGLGVRLPRQEHGAGVLSPREIEVAELVAEGLSNPAIARRLYLAGRPLRATWRTS